MHSLRWPKVLEYFERESQAASLRQDWRTHSVAEDVVKSFRDYWGDRDLFPYYQQPGRSPAVVMKIQYKNTFRDILAFCLYHYPRSPFVIVSYGIGFALISFTIFRALPKDGNPVTNGIVFVGMELVVFSIFVAVLALSALLSMISRKNKTVFTEHTIALGEESFITETPYSKTEQKWKIVQKLARTRKHIFIYVAQHMAHVVPRRAFRDDLEWEGFYDYCWGKTQEK